MGASSSISPQPSNLRLKDNTYISYSYDDGNAERLHAELLNSGYHILQTNFQTEEEGTYTIKKYQQMVKDVMVHSKNIIICVSEKTVTSFSQAIEINIALDSDANIVYIFTDEPFSPTNTPYLNGLVGYNLWLPAHDMKSMGVAIETMETYQMLS